VSPLRPLACRRELQTLSPGIDPADYSVVVKNRARPPNPWRWEIYRAGRRSPIAQSTSYFELSSTASSEGKAALARLLKELTT
jgi:hypothetical protein